MADLPRRQPHKARAVSVCHCIDPKRKFYWTGLAWLIVEESLTERLCVVELRRQQRDFPKDFIRQRSFASVFEEFE